MSPNTGSSDRWLTHQILCTPSRPALSALEQQWLLTNGTGAYAASTVPGINTSQYHGLLVACTHPPVGRVVVLNQMLERLTLAVSGQSFDSLEHNPSSRKIGAGAESSQDASELALDFSSLLFVDDSQNAIANPQGHSLLRRFEKGLFTRWTYSWGQIQFVRELYLHWKEQAATLRYLVTIPSHEAFAQQTQGGVKPEIDAVLHLSPMMTLRDFHGLSRKQAGELSVSAAKSGHVVVQRGDLAATLSCDKGVWRRHQDQWWYNIYYPHCHERGQDSFEDYQVPGSFEVKLIPGCESEICLTVALGKQPANPVRSTTAPREQHLEKALEHIQMTQLEEPLRRSLVVAADDFVVDRVTQGRKLTTIMAGYPWFADWGRDTFISLTGLLLETGRFQEARNTLELYSRSLQGGLVPNRFDDYNDQAAHYNTADASLWFIHAAINYVDTTNDRDFWKQILAQACLQIMDAYIKGTQYGIQLTGDGLISAGGPATQLTWMDAACGGVVFTPRYGKAVEINALWYHVLVNMARTIKPLGAAESKAAAHYSQLADRVKRSFVKVFWNQRLGYLHDHVYTDQAGSEQADATLRPNQVLALCFESSPLAQTKQTIVLRVLKDRLLTPYGLRTLPADDPNYHSRYTGPQFGRDEAYHQGTIWPWLIGPYAQAVLRIGGFKENAVNEARAAIAPLIEQLQGPGLGQLNEIFEADPLPFHAPLHRPVGCFAQAWSIAQLLQVLRLIECPESRRQA